MSDRRKAAKKVAFYQQAKDREKLELLSQAEFTQWAAITWVKFVFSYCNNEFNKKAGRVGRIASFRIGTTNPDLIPSSDKARSYRNSAKVTAYYDVSRAGTTVRKGITSGGLPGKVLSNAAQPGQWRSFRKETFSIMVQLWSFEKEEWVDSPSEFNSTDQTSG